MDSGEARAPLANREDDWDRVTDCVESFVRAWDATVASEKVGPDASVLIAPDLQSFLPAERNTLGRLVLGELVKVDLEYRWLHRREPQCLEHYCVAFPDLTTLIDAELVYEEYHVRRQAGDIVSRDDYRCRFPALVPALERLWANCEGSDSGTNASTVLYGKPAQDRPSLTPSRQPRPADLQSGEVVDEFQILRKLGQGTFGSVYLAMQQSMQRLVAVKISPDRGDEPRTLAQLDHEHIVRVFDQRVVTDRSLRLMYMQYIAGGSLSDVVKLVQRTPVEQRNGTLLYAVVDQATSALGESPPTSSRIRTRLMAASWPEVVCWIGARLSAALDYAHRHGVIHRDLKPANVLLTMEGLPKLVDFNISFSSKVEGSSPAAYFGGSLAYMSPEQLEAASPRYDRQPQDLDGRSDLFSLAVLLCELLTGQRPFPDGSQQTGWSQMLDELLQYRRQGNTTSPFEGEEHWPEGLARTLRRCLASAVEDRPKDAAELTRTFELCLRPHARRLLFRKGSPIVDWMGRHPMAALISAAAFPNLMFCLFNIYYNRTEVLNQHPDLREPMWGIQWIMIAVTTPPAVAAVVWQSWTITQAVKNRDTPKDRLVTLRNRCAHFGHTASMISLATWVLSGLAFAVLAGARLSSIPEQIQLSLSLMLRGLMASVYPFFPTTFIALRFMYPRLVRLSTMREEDEQSLERLRLRVNVYQILAALVPMVTLALLVLTDNPGTSMLAFLVFRSGMSFAIVLVFSRMILEDINALQFTIRSRRWPDD